MKTRFGYEDFTMLIYTSSALQAFESEEKTGTRLLFYKLVSYWHFMDTPAWIQWA